ncbi:MAG: nucleotidyltransferase domain-containing protein [Nitrospinae bacterium]|nr:nucleotidyltransferase domain-containing protein [Nitrospinota bacterium]
MGAKRHNSHTDRLLSRDLIQPPRWLTHNLMFEGITGSEAYGCADKSSSSDIDIVGFVIPPKEYIFPHLSGYIQGFNDSSKKSFDQFLAEGVEDKETKRNYDVVIYNIVKFFSMTMDNNPNMIDSLFLPRRCITRSTAIYEHVRNNRHVFLSTKSYHTFRGYANSQLSKITRKTNSENPKRAESIKKYGYDVKFGYHLVRLMLECEQILTTGTLVLDRDAKTYNAIRRGEWDLDRLVNWFTSKESSLEKMVSEAVVPHSCDKGKIKQILVECLEMHYGDLSNEVVLDKSIHDVLDDMEDVIRRYRK